MPTKLTGLPSFAYLGVEASSPPNIVQVNRAPTTTDFLTFNTGDLWLNIAGLSLIPQVLPTAADIWMLVSKQRNIGRWVNFGGGGGNMRTLTGDNAVVVPPNGVGNINVISNVAALNSGSSVSFTGNAATNTLTLNLSDANQNTILGINSGRAGISGTMNASLGFATLTSLTSGNRNFALGSNSLQLLTTGSDNVALGQGSGGVLLTGSTNILIGRNAGLNYVGAESSNILIGNTGTVTENNVIRIGSTQTTCFIAGIAGVTTTVNDAVPVLISASTSQLGTISSSIKYKENIKDMGIQSDLINYLRPVTFNYKKNPDVPAWGLIAEEVHQVFPQLVVYDKDGLPETVKYHDLVPLLLNELKKLAKRVSDLEKGN